MSNEFHDLVVKQVIAETDDAKSFVLEITSGLRDLFGYDAGQFLTARVVVAGRELQRCYSLSSVHGLDADLKITVKRVPYGPVSNWFNDSAAVGDRLAVMRPAGFFTNRKPGQDLALFAAGSGITPIIALAKSALHASTAEQVFLFYANRNEQSVIFRAELHSLGQQFPDRLRVIHWLETVQGVPSIPHMAALARGLSHCESFVCGPAPFMEAVEAALLTRGVDQHRIHLERFTFTPPRETPADELIAEARLGLTETTQLEVTLDGQTHVIAWDPAELMLDALEKAGLKPPYSCRSGSCGACICTLVSGEAVMRVNDLLDATDIAEGLLLSCQAVARSPAIKVTY